MAVFATNKNIVSKLPKIFTSMVTVFEIILVVILSYLASSLIKGMMIETAEINTYVENNSQSNASKKIDNFSNLILTDAFFGAFQDTNTQSLVIAPESTLDLKIYGLRTRGNGQGTAILKPQGEVQKLYQTGENVSDTVRLTSVYHDRIEISRSGSAETIYLDKERSSRSVVSEKSGTLKQNIQVSNQVKTEKIEEVIAALDLNPFRKNNRISGFVIGEEAEAIVLIQAGLEAGDILYEVNGEELISWERIAEISENSNNDGLNIKFERHGEIQTLTLSNLILGL